MTALLTHKKEPKKNTQDQKQRNCWIILFTATIISSIVVIVDCLDGKLEPITATAIGGLMALSFKIVGIMANGKEVKKNADKTKDNSAE